MLIHVIGVAKIESPYTCVETPVLDINWTQHQLQYEIQWNFALQSSPGVQVMAIVMKSRTRVRRF